MRSLWRTNKEIAEIYRRNVKTVFRVCVLFFRGNAHDAEDAVQTTFLRLMKDTTPFRSTEHEKAWLIVTAGNVCKNILTSGWRKHVDMDEAALQQQAVQLEIDETFASVMMLPGKYKMAIYMPTTRATLQRKSQTTWARPNPPSGGTSAMAGTY